MGEIVYNKKLGKLFKLQKGIQGLVNKEYAALSNPIFLKLQILKLNDVLNASVQMNNYMK